MTLSEPGAGASKAWPMSVRLLVRWLDLNERVDALLESLPRDLPRVERARMQSLLFGAVRHLGRIEAHLSPLLSKPPRTKLRAILLLAGCELIEGGPEGHVARVVHHAVEQTKTLASPSEARLVNAVVRKLAAALEAEPAPGPQASAHALAAYYSHPAWLVDRWWVQFGAGPTRDLLAWNQRPAPLYARWRAAEGPDATQLVALKETPWPGFFEIRPGHWADVEPLLSAGKLYIQDPATRFAVELIAPKSGEAILDACAAPGGKSLALADALGSGKLVAFDLPGPRIDRLTANLALAPSTVNVAVVQGDLTQGAARLFNEHGLAIEYPAVLLDVPCSNTGVMRHRVDVKWRLQEGDFSKHARQQLALLESASRFVASKGRLVYSTCSLDPEENEKVVAAFIRKAGTRFKLADQRISRPWESGHDGAAAFLIRRID
ncbi:MAG TPA: RsmB/NOP family class I SAM-dependent RNA methyltransferase [Opitutaceae bacterium]